MTLTLTVLLGTFHMLQNTRNHITPAANRSGCQYNQHSIKCILKTDTDLNLTKLL